MPGKPAKSDDDLLVRINGTVLLHIPVDIWEMELAFRQKEEIGVHLQDSGEFILTKPK
jgi:hypothetical protein